MIRLPEPYRALKKYPGYFWNVDDQRLYSIKMTGVLTRLKVRVANEFSRMEPGMHYYTLSVEGKKKNVPVVKIKELALKDFVIPERK